MAKCIVRKPFLLSLKFNLLMTTTIIVLLSFATAAHAEYYFVTPCMDTCHHRHIIKKKKHVYVTHHRVRYHRPIVAVYYVYPTCCTCQEVWVQGRWDCYDNGCGGRRYVRYYEGYDVYERGSPSYVREEVTYDPDLTTGDDDTWVNPDMDIDE